MIQYVIVCLCLCVAIAYAASRIFRLWLERNNPSCGCEGCEGCPLKNQGCDKKT